MTSQNRTKAGFASSIEKEGVTEPIATARARVHAEGEAEPTAYSAATGKRVVAEAQRLGCRQVHGYTFTHQRSRNRRPLARPDLRGLARSLPVIARWLAILAPALLPLAAAPLVGTWAAGVSGLLVALLASLLLASLAGWRPGRLACPRAPPGGLRGLVGVASALSALALAASAGAGGLLAGRRPVAA